MIIYQGKKTNLSRKGNIKMEDNLMNADPLSYTTNGSRVDLVKLGKLGELGKLGKRLLRA